MKKAILILVGLMLFIGLFAESIDRQTAESIAQNWFKQWNDKDEYSAKIINVEITKKKSHNLFYTFSFEDQGFVIVSADDNIVPILGYSLTSKIKTPVTNSAIKEFLMFLEEQSFYLISNNIENQENRISWEKVLQNDFSNYETRFVTPLLQTEWDQGQYYNDNCPVDATSSAGNNHVWAGCVATAMAQCVKYWEHPSTGVGTHSYTHPTYGNQSADFGTTTYNWSSMPNALTAPNSDVATLLYHLGVSVDMDYGPNGSGAYSSDAKDALINYFQYKDSANFIWKSSYTDPQWKSILTNELDNGRPMYYRGDNGTSGHAFVCDGYQTSDYFHFNWGWSGYYDGYFYLNDLTPGTHSFNYDQGAIIGLEPDNILAPPTDLLTNLNISTGEVQLSWLSGSRNSSNNISRSFQYFNVYRDGLIIGTIADTIYIDNLPNYGSYDYEVTAYYDEGESISTGIATVEWLEYYPDITVSPTEFNEIIASGDTQTKILTIENTGDSDLEWNSSADIDTTSTQYYVGSGAETEHIFNCGNLFNDITLTVTINGDFNNASEYCDLYIEGVLYQTIDGGANYTDIITEIILPASDVTNWTLDGVFTIILDNSSAVDPGYGTQLHQVRVECEGLPAWITLSEYDGVVPMSNSQDIEVIFNTNGLNAGDYSTEIPIMSNDPDEAELNIPVNLTVTGEPNIAVSSDSLNFGGLFVGATIVDTLIITNTGIDTLIVSDIVSNNSDFAISRISFSLPPSESQEVFISFNPSIEGEILGELTISSNDVSDPDYIVILSGTGLIAPDIAVNPTEFNENIVSGDSSIQILTIENTGGSDLDFDITITETARADYIFDVSTFKDNYENRSINNSTNGIIKKSDFSKRIYKNQKQFRDFENILVMEESAGNMHYDNALNNLGLSRTLVTNWGALESELTNGTEWDIVIINSYSHFSTTSQLDNIDSYLVNGGKLIYCDWGLSTYTNHSLLQNIGISFVSSITTPINFSTVLPVHPIFNNPNEISNFFWTDDQYGTDGQIVDILGGATQLAAFDGYVNSGACVLNAAETCFFNAFQADNFNDDNDSDGKLDMVELIENQIIYFMEGSSVSWLNADPITGTVTAGSSMDIELTFDTTGLDADTYLANLLIASNDPDESEIIVPVNLTVTGEPNIATSSDSLNFGGLFIGATTVDTLIITNTGVDTLIVTDIISNNPDFSIGRISFNLPPSESQEVFISFTPSLEGEILGELTISSNDVSDPNYIVNLSGLGLVAPDITVNPIEFNEIIVSGDSGMSVLTIENVGGSDLEWNSSTDIDTTSTQYYVGSGAETEHIFNCGNLFNDITLTVTINGDFDNASEYCDLYIEGVLYQTIDGGANYTDIITEIILAATDVTNWTLDGVLTITLDNSPEVNTGYGTQLHQIRFESEGLPAWITLSEYSGVVPMSNSQDIEVNFDTNGLDAGDYSTEILIMSNDPDEPEIIVPVNLTVTGEPNLSTSSDSLNFGGLFIGATTVDTLIITNTGVDTLIVSDIISNNPDFAVGRISFSLPPSESQEVFISFTPSLEGEILGELTIFSNDVSDPNYIVNLSGVGLVAPDIAVNPIEFNETIVSGDTETSILTIENTGGSDLEWNSSTDIDTTSTQYYVGSGAETEHIFNCGNLFNDITLTVTINGDFDNASEYCDLYIEGVLYQTIDGGANYTDIITEIILAATDVTNWTLDGVLTITLDNSPEVNTGYGTQLHQIRLESEGLPAWIALSEYSGVVPMSNSQDIEVNFDTNGLDAGDYSTEILIMSNDPDESEIIVPVNLTVTGEPNIAVSSDSLNFGGLFIGATTVDTLIITNTGVDTLIVTDIISNNPDFSIGRISFSLPPSESQEVFISFTPSSEGEILGELTISSNDVSDPDYIVNLSGVGLIAPDIAVNPIEFNEIIVSGDSLSQILTIENNGGSDLIFSISKDFPSTRARQLGRYADENRLSNSTLRQNFESKFNAKKTKTNRDTGDILGTYYNSSDSNTGMVWVNNYLYMLNYNSGQLLKYDIEIESVLESFSIHNNPSGITWDGEYLWIGNSSGNVYAYNLDGTQTGFSFSCPFSQYLTLAWDGEYFICNQLFQSNASFYRLDETGTIIDEFETSFGAEIGQIVWVSEHPNGHLWSLDNTYSRFLQLELENGNTNLISEFNYPENVDYAIAHNGEDLWASDFNAETIYQIDDGIKEFDWLSYNIENGVIPTGSSTDIELIFNTIGLNADTYLANLLIASNDPDEPEIIVPVNLTITGEPNIATSSDSLNFGELFMGATRVDTLIITNTGVDTLIVSDIISNNPDFAVGRISFSLPPSESQEVFISFTPSSEGEILGELTISSNDVSDPDYIVNLSGVGLIAPDIAVNPIEFNEIIVSGDTETSILTIENVGGSDLVWEINNQSGIVINEIYVGDEDWLEIYNNTGESINLNNWYINWTKTSGSSDSIILPEFILNHGQYVVISEEAGSNTSTHIYVNQNITWVDSEGGSCALLDDLGVGIDFMRWGSSIIPPPVDLIWTENTILPKPDDFNSLGRDANSTDTDSSDDWFLGNITEALPNIPFSRDIVISEWLSININSGVVPMGNSQDIEITFDTNGLDAGDYSTEILIMSNDPDEAELNIPVNLTVTGEPNIAVSSDSLNFGGLFMGATTVDTLIITNTGVDTLIVTDIISNNPDFTIGRISFSLPPLESQEVFISFTPSSEGEILGELTISSNDVSDPDYIVNLSGVGLIAPDIAVNPIEFNENIVSGDTEISILTIENTGGSDLEWEISQSLRNNRYITSDLYDQYKHLSRVEMRKDANNSGKMKISPIPIDAINSRDGIVDILAWVTYTDMSEEYVNTLNAISQYFTDYTITTTTETDPAILSSELVDKNVFLIPEQESGSQSIFSNLGINWESILTDFVSTGGKIILCGSGEGAHEILNSSNLMNLNYQGFINSGIMSVLDQTHFITSGLPETIPVQNATILYNIPDPEALKLVEYNGAYSVAIKDIQAGAVILIGYDFYDYDDNAAMIISNAVQYPTGSNWLSYDIETGIVPAGSSRDIELTFNTAELNADTYLANLLIASNDPDEPEIIVPVNLTVTGEPNIAVSSDSLYFGGLFMGATRVDTLIITNTGVDTLIVTDIISNNPDFTIGRISFSLPPLESQEVFISFTPSSEGEILGELTISSNDVSDPDYIVNLSGVGLIAPNIAVNPIEFNENIVSGDTKTSVLTIENVGGSDLEWNSSTDIDTTSTQYYVGSGAETEHLFNCGNLFNNITLTVTINGDFDSASEYCDLYIEGVLYQTIDGGATGTDIITEIILAATDVTNWTLDGVLTITLDNSPEVNTGYGTQLHQIRLESEGLPAWITLSEYNGVVSMSNSQDIDVNFDTNGLDAGDYSTEIPIISNDPDEPEILIPVNLTVTGEPNIAVSSDSLNFGELFMGATRVDTLIITNTGVDTLIVTDIISNNPDFSIGRISFSLPPSESQEVFISFTPSSEGEILGELTISSNDVSDPDFIVNLSGVGLIAPDIAVNPIEFNENIVSGDTETSILTIENTGGSDLEWNLNIINDEAIRSINSMAKVVRESQNKSKTNNRDVIEESMGSWDSAYSGSNRIRGNVYFIESSTFLIEHKFYLSTSMNSSLYFMVYESTGLNDDYSLISDSYIENSGIGEEWFSSGPINVELQAGKYYLLATNWDNAAGYGMGGPSCGTGDGDLSFGYHAGNFGDNTYSAPEPVIAGYDINNCGQAYYQSFVTSTSGPTPEWLSSDIETGIVPAGSSRDIELTFNTTGLDADTYLANLLIASNDPDEPEIIVPVNLTVTGEPNIAVSSDSLYFGELLMGATTVDTLIITNTGADTLIVTDIISNNPDFSVGRISFSLSPSESQEVFISFTPSLEGEILGELTISSNDVSDPNYIVILSGTGLIPPDIAINPVEFNEVIASGDTGISVLTIENTGGSDLEWETEDSSCGQDSLFITFDGGNVQNGNMFDITTVSSGIIIQGFNCNIVSMGTMEFEVYFKSGSYYGFENSPSDWTLLGTDSVASNGVENPTYVNIGGLSIASGETYGIYISITNGFNLEYSGGSLEVSDDYLTFTSGTGNAYPFSTIYSPRIWNGEIIYAIEGAFQPWLSLSEYSGVVPMSNSHDIEVNFDTNGLDAGDYSTEILIISNDPDEPEINIPVNLTVTGEPNIAVSSDSLNFGGLFIGATIVDTLIITNTGIDTLIVTDIISNNPDFAIGRLSFNIPPSESQEIFISFTPSLEGEILGELTISSNDISDPDYTVNLSGLGVSPYPAPENLLAEVDGNNVSLNWEAPPYAGGEEFMEDFESGTLPTDWIIVDNDGDGYNWEVSVNWGGNNDSAHCMTSASYRNDVGALFPDNWLISPALTIGESSELHFWVAAQDPGWAAEQYYVKVSTSGDQISDFTNTIHSQVLSTHAYTEVVLSLSDFAGQTIYLAWQHADVTDMFWINLDDISVINTTTREVSFAADFETAKSARQFKTGNSFKNENFRDRDLTGYPIRTTGMNREQIDNALNEYTKILNGRDLLGYNIYRNDSLLVYTTDLFYDDMALPNGTYEYYVTAIYDANESVPSNTVEAIVDNIQVGSISGTVTNSSDSTPIENAQITAGIYTAISDSLGNYLIENAIADTYSVSCSADGFEEMIIGDVEVIEGQNTIVDFPLIMEELYPPSNLQYYIQIQTNVFLSWDSPQTSVRMNNNKHSARKENNKIRKLGRDDKKNFNEENETKNTRSFIGYNVYKDGIQINSEIILETNYSDLELPNGTYSYYVTALYNTGESVPSTTVEVTIEYIELNLLFNDDFEAGDENWNIVINSGEGTWMIYSELYPNPYSLPPTSSGNVMAADSDQAGSGTTTDTDLILISPLDCSTSNTVVLEFDSDFRNYDYDDNCSVYVSNDNGVNWNSILYYGDDARQTHEIIDISQYAANQAEVLIKFVSIQPGWDWWWAIDNVQVFVDGDIPQIGTLAGTVTNSADDSPIEGAQITAGTYSVSTDVGGNYTIPDMDIGTYTITCSMSDFETQEITNVEILLDQTTIIDFALVEILLPPENLTGETIGNDVVLNWNVPAVSEPVSSTKHNSPLKKAIDVPDGNYRETNLTGYNVYRDFILIATIMDSSLTSYTDESLSNGLYTYFVTALYDLSESVPSNSVQAEIGITPLHTHQISAGWNLIGTPVTAPPDSSITPEAIFGDDIYPFYTYPFYSSIYAMNSENLDYFVPEEIELGTGYWLNGGSDNVEIDAYGYIIHNDLTISLPGGADPESGWHLLANPYDVPVLLDNIIMTDVQEGGYIYNTETDSYELIMGDSLLSEWNGIFMKGNTVNSSVTFRYPDPVRDRDNITPKERDEWFVHLSANSETHQAMMITGASENSLNGYDSEDFPALPPLPFIPEMGKLKLYSVHNDWEEHSGNYTRDMMNSQNEEWIYPVQLSAINDITISITEYVNIPAEYDIIIENLTTNEIVNLRTDNLLISINSENSEEEIVELKLRISENPVNNTEDIIPEYSLNLYQNYPNPFNPTTTIEFSLPKEAQVNLSVYNIKGQKIVELVNEEMKKGYNIVEWNGKDSSNQISASGVYFYKLIYQDKELVRKMLMLK